MKWNTLKTSQVSPGGETIERKGYTKAIKAIEPPSGSQSASGRSKTIQTVGLFISYCLDGIKTPSKTSKNLRKQIKKMAYLSQSESKKVIHKKGRIWKLSTDGLKISLF